MNSIPAVMSTEINRKCYAILDALLELEVVRKGRVWNRIPGKERVYIDLVKLDGDAGHNAGVGHTMFIDVHTGFICFAKERKWAGPKTRAYHQQAKTIQQVRRVVGNFVHANRISGERQSTES